METIPLEQVGLITRGPCNGQFVLVRDDGESTGGFMLFQSVAPDLFSANEVFDTWVERLEDLEGLFAEAEWGVQWQQQ